MKEKTFLLESWKPLLPPDKLKQETTHVELTAKIEDFNCVLLATRGVKAKRIAWITGLSVGQVYYRLNQAQFKFTQYRDGTGPYAVLYRDTLNREGARQVTTVLRAVIADRPKLLTNGKG